MGIEDIKAQFRALVNIPMVKTEISSVLLSTKTDEGLVETRDLVIIDAVITFGFYLFSIPIRCITRLEFNIEGLIVVHEDIWSLQHIIENFPIIGRLYDVCRSVTGCVSSGVIRALVMVYHQISTPNLKKLSD
jgi:hypothetical protein